VVAHQSTVYDETGDKCTMLLSVEGLDAVACGFVLSELRHVLGRIDLGLFVPQLSFKDVDCEE
jgi:hypothetical protein